MEFTKFTHPESAYPNIWESSAIIPGRDLAVSILHQDADSPYAVAFADAKFRSNNGSINWAECYQPSSMVNFDSESDAVSWIESNVINR